MKIAREKINLSSLSTVEVSPLSLRLPSCSVIKKALLLPQYPIRQVFSRKLMAVGTAEERMHRYQALCREIDERHERFGEYAPAFAFPTPFAWEDGPYESEVKK